MHHQAEAAAGVEIGPVPVANSAARGQEGRAVRPAEMETVAAVGQLQVDRLGHPFRRADIVLWTAEDGEHPQHQTLVGRHVYVVEGDLVVRPRRIWHVIAVDA